MNYANLLPTNLASRVYFGLDLLFGHARGASCPNCGNKRSRSSLVDTRHVLLTVRACSSCGLLYRPVGLQSRRLLELYYSTAYGDAGIATSPGAGASLTELEPMMRAEGKDRRELLAPLLAELGVERPKVCVLGCSWGYEMLAIRELGCEVVGIEIGASRREFGRTSLGLDIYPSAEELTRAGHRVDVVISSHVLEHIPRLESVLDDVFTRLSPKLSVHITPCVEYFDTDASVRRLVGREHPLGVTRAFWERFAARRGLRAEIREVGVVPGRECGETVALLRR